MLRELTWENANLHVLLDTYFQTISQKYKGVMVGCSGGSDSIALLDVLLKYTRQKKKFNLAVCHMNFGLRAKDSDADMAFVKSFCLERGVEFHHKKVRPPEIFSGQSVQLWARRERRRWFSELAAQGWAIALGHHQDDVAENVLMRLARGSEAGKMSGMKVWSDPYFRPLLFLSKEQLLEWLKMQNLPHRADASNDKVIYSRNLVRHKVLPVLEGLHTGAAGRISRTAHDAAVLDEWLCKSFPVRDGRLSLEWLARVPDAVASRALRYFLQVNGVDHVQRQLLDSLIMRFRCSKSLEVDLNKECRLVREGDDILVLRKTHPTVEVPKKHEAALKPKPMKWVLANGGSIKMFDSGDTIKNNGQKILTSTLKNKEKKL